MARRLANRPAAIARRVPLRVILEPDPETRSVFEKLAGAPDSVFFAGTQTSDAHVCGACGSPLILGLPLAQFQNLALRCSACGAYNETVAGGPVRRQSPKDANRRTKRPRRRK